MVLAAMAKTKNRKQPKADKVRGKKTAAVEKASVTQDVIVLYSHDNDQYFFVVIFPKMCATDIH